MNKEHVWPEWLITKTRTHLTEVRHSPGEKVNPRSMTVPLCVDCNSAFGEALENPVKKVLADLEAGLGLSDQECSIFVRWLWKLTGLATFMDDPEMGYHDGRTMRERVLSPLGNTGQVITLAISLAEAIDPAYKDEPMGLDSKVALSAVYVAGVFGRVAVMVLLREFDTEVPKAFSLYHSSEEGAEDRDAKLFFPKTGFKTCEAAVFETALSAAYLSYAHDYVVRLSQQARGIPGPA
jgi:hypothetical protein